MAQLQAGTACVSASVEWLCLQLVQCRDDLHDAVPVPMHTATRVPPSLDPVEFLEVVSQFGEPNAIPRAYLPWPLLEYHFPLPRSETEFAAHLEMKEV